MGKCSISIITAAFNAQEKLPALISSLRVQTDRDFEWVVVDGASHDRTIELVRTSGIDRVVLISEPDFGIYDALNKGLEAASGDYYLVLGADDVLEPGAVANYRHAVVEEGSSPDIVTASIRSGMRLGRAQSGKGWLYGMQGYVSAHSIGSLIRRGLHEQFGYYSRRFPIAADHYFIKRAALGGAYIKVCDFCAGSFGQGGVSSVDAIGTLTEFLRVQLATEPRKAVQLLLFFLRLLRHYRRL